jgi:hypothetical protein
VDQAGGRDHPQPQADACSHLATGALGSQPGVENKNESVVRHITIARALPVAHALRDQGRSAIKSAMPTSTSPSPVENCRTVHIPYIQPMNGLWATSGWMPFASYPVNFIIPIQPMTSANP